MKTFIYICLSIGNFYGLLYIMDLYFIETSLYEQKYLLIIGISLALSFLLFLSELIDKFITTYNKIYKNDK